MVSTLIEASPMHSYTETDGGVGWGIFHGTERNGPEVV